MKSHIIIYIAILLMATGCATKRMDIEQQTVAHDSTRIEYRERLVYIPDTVQVEIPALSAERETRDSVSILENTYAKSIARIDSNGVLFHSLHTKPQSIPIEIQKPTLEVERTTVHDSAHSDVKTVTKTEYIERDLSWWQKTQIYGFYALLFIVLINYRKKIFQAVVRVFAKK